MMKSLRQFCSLWLLLLLPKTSLLAAASEPQEEDLSMPEEEKTPGEILFTEAVGKWFGSNKGQPLNDWTVFLNLADELWKRFQQPDKEEKIPMLDNMERVDLVSAMEESILVVEGGAIRPPKNGQQNQVSTSSREAALVALYTVYGYSMNKLTPQECEELASDPDSLLADAAAAAAEAADTANTPQSSLRHPLCVQNAASYLRKASKITASSPEAKEWLDNILDGEEEETEEFNDSPSSGSDEL